MDVLGVDLAAVSSAAVRLTPDMVVVDEFDSLSLGTRGFITRIVEHGLDCDNFARRVPVCSGRAILAVEDTPPGLRFDINTKKAVTIHGQIIETIYWLRQMGSISGVGLPLPPELHMPQPLEWMRHFGYKSKAVSGSTAAFAKRISEQMGYYPPPTIPGHSSKLLQDFRSAYLIARYFHEAKPTKRRVALD